MKKVVMQPIRPSEMVNILNGKQTIIILKRLSKWVLAEIDKGNTVEVHLYCTKARSTYRIGHQVFYNDELYRLPNGKIKYGSSVELMAYDNYNNDNFLNGLIVAKFQLKKIEKLSYEKHHTTRNTIASSSDYKLEQKVLNVFVATFDEPLIEKQSCLNATELWNYLGEKDGYALHIEDLEIFDKPRELSEYYVYNQEYANAGAFGWALTSDEYIPLTRAPMNMQRVYVEE